ncbi:putative sodium:solute symporter [Burkholderiales bacterium JOSHI_001]|nr:putative sodium:solute symporter [Burkholderiales bacterium JOSHI_001]
MIARHKKAGGRRPGTQTRAAALHRGKMSSFSAGDSGSIRVMARVFRRRLDRLYIVSTVIFIAFIVAFAMFERMGLPRAWIGFFFLVAPVILYAGIGILSRTADADEYYVAGRRVPAFYNGMATAADWMSAASFMGLAGTVYLSGYDGLAYILGWTGGFVLVALFIAPYLNRFGQYTIADFLGARYEGHLPRLVGVFAAILCSFTYVVAQIYGVGLITTRLTGFTFELGIFVGLGGVLVCSFLGGMKAVTWTQVAQCIILLIAYLTPVVWLSVKQTGVPVPQLVVGAQLQKVTEREIQLRSDPRELEVIAALKLQAEELRGKLRNVPVALAVDRAAAQARLSELKAENAPLARVQAQQRVLLKMPRDPEEARRVWSAQLASAEGRARPLGGLPPHAQAFRGDPHGSPAEKQEFDIDRRNFLALVLCLMLGTAGLPHILVRSYAAASVREARESVGWSMLFIALLYVTAPALAVLVKYEVFNVLVGTSFDSLPHWISAWAKVDPSLLSVSDVNRDGLLQLSEISIDADIIVLATPEIAGLPYVISAMVAAGGLAAALSTADGLLLTIANALSHDTYYRVVDPQAGMSRRVTISKVLLLVAALLAAYVAAQKPANIVFLVSAAFSIAAAAFFPALVLGVFWRRANRWGAACGMLAGLGVTLYYLTVTHPGARAWLGLKGPVQLWWDIQPVSAGIFGVATGFLTIALVSLATPAPGLAAQRLVDRLRGAPALQVDSGSRASR